MTLSDDDAVTVERSGPVTTVGLLRPHARNAVDGLTGAARSAAGEGRHGQRVP
jgi:enoyl-CoA hydratase